MTLADLAFPLFAVGVSVWFYFFIVRKNLAWEWDGP